MINEALDLRYNTTHCATAFGTLFGCILYKQADFDWACGRRADKRDDMSHILACSGICCLET